MGLLRGSPGHHLEARRNDLEFIQARLREHALLSALRIAGIGRAPIGRAERRKNRRDDSGCVRELADRASEGNAAVERPAGDGAKRTRSRGSGGWLVAEPGLE